MIKIILIILIILSIIFILVGATILEDKTSTPIDDFIGVLMETGGIIIIAVSIILLFN